MGLIYELRSNEKPRWKEIFPRAIIKVFGEENLANGEYSQSINEPHPSGLRIVKGSHIAWRKVLNPFKSLIEFPLTLLEDYADRACQILAPYPASDDFDHSHTRLANIKPFYNYRWIPRLFVKIAIGLPVGIIRRFTSPINTIYRPLVQYAQKHPFLFLGIVLPIGLLVGGLVFASVIWGGAVPVLGAVIGLQKLMHVIGAASMVAGSHLALWTGLNATVAVVMAKTAFVLGAFIGSMALAHKISHKFVHSLADIYELGLPTHLQKDAKGQLIQDVSLQEKQSYVPSSGKQNAISRLFFNTPKTQNVMDPETLGNSYAWRSHFGGYSLRDDSQGISLNIHRASGASTYLSRDEQEPFLPPGSSAPASTQAAHLSPARFTTTPLAYVSKRDQAPFLSDTSAPASADAAGQSSTSYTPFS